MLLLYICTIVNIPAIETPGGKRILVKNIIAQQITRKRGILKKPIWNIKNIYCVTFRHITSDIIRLNTKYS